MRPGPFALYPEPRRPKIPESILYTTAGGDWCANCFWRDEWARERVPCARCDEECSEWRPRRLPSGHTLVVGMVVGGRNCVGRPWSGRITRIVGPLTFAIDGTLYPAGLVDWIEIDGVRQPASFGP